MVATEKKTFSLTLKGIAPLVSEVRYEKKEQDVTLYITIQKNMPVRVLVDDASITCKRLAPLGPLSKKLLSTIEYWPSSDLYIAFLRPEDFASCQASPKSVRTALEELRDCASQNSSFVILFETKERKDTQCLAWSEKERVLNAVASICPGSRKGNWALGSSSGPIAAAKKLMEESL
ncbi:MAG: hypothetical protein HY482_01080 [Candidatus Wildermuthbacteria bacterium]|nr:hypothetical protein [Candidatus Wildermuthbacteria bacterium]